MENQVALVRSISLRVILIICIFFLGLHQLSAQLSANFTANNTSGCSPLAVQFTNLSSIPDPANTTYFWNLGNGNTSVFPNPFVIYTNPGTYTVTLTITDTTSGNTSTRQAVDFITIYEDPNVDFSADVANGCAPLTVNFTDLSSAGDTSIVSWLWDFGDGNTSTDQNPTHTYNTTGVFDVTLVVEDANGCDGVFTAFDYINTSSVATIDFTADQQIACTAPHTVNFTSSVNPFSANYTYDWDFGDGNTSTDQNPTHQYAIDGFFDVTLTVSDPNGCSATLTRNTYIQIDQPNAAYFPTTQNTCVGQSLQFFNTSTGADSYLWNFGDGNTSTAEEPSHMYLSPGTYTVSLTATNSSFGCSDQEVRTAYITVNTSPSVNFSSNNNISCATPTTVNFTDLSTGAVSWLWDFGNGSTSNSANFADHTYLNAGNYDVSLTVTNSVGCSATEIKPAFVRINPPVADFVGGPQVAGCLPLTVNFINTSTSIDSITTYIWNFGDGTTSSAANPTHTFTAEGTFDISLVIITASGCRDTALFPGYIEAGRNPNADFSANPRAACVGANIDFTDLSDHATQWQWNFGDATGSNVQNPTHAYADTGLFDVILVVRNYGCYDTVIRQDYIDIVGPVADFDKTPDEACGLPASVSFFDQSIGATGYFWDFGDGNTSTQQNPTHIYNATGTFVVRLFTTDSLSGCTDEYFEDQIVGNPIANFTQSPSFGCTGTSVSLTNLSQNATDYIWDFGDGNTSTDEDPTHTYTTPGNYTIILTATQGGCTDTVSSSSQVEIVGPTPDFSANVTEGCLPFNVNFTDNTTPSPGKTINNWLWDFGDGTTSNLQNPTHTYTSAGSYTVSLTVLDSDGCPATFTRNDYIRPSQPTADFTSNDSIACPNTFIQFTSLSTGTGISHSWQFGDGATSPVANPVHVYPAQGLFSVILTVTDINGCTDTEAKTNFIRVSNPVANFIADSTSADCPPLPVNFFDQSSADVSNWVWEFGDGSISNERNPSKVYNNAGDFSVRLTVTTPQGCTDTEEKTDFISINGPTGSFDFTPKVGCFPIEVTFTGTGVNIVDYSWDFGDGSGGNGQTVSHTYTRDTVATPVMLIEDINGCRVAITTTDSINILPLPIPNFTVDYTTLCLGETASFTNTTQSESPISQYFWDFGDSTTSALANPTKVYTEADTFSVFLRVTSIDGCTDSITRTGFIRVTETPEPAFTVNPSRACEPSSVAFTDSSNSAFSLVDWDWQFGDGNTANGQIIPNHTYTDAGIYTTTLTVTDNQGCTGSISQNVTVDSLPIIDFSANRYGCAPRSILFTDQTSGQANPVSWFWDFGDGNTSTNQNPTHTFTADGNYDITLTVTDANGCINTRTKSEYIVLDRPVANFTSSANPGCPPQLVQFTDLSIPDTTVGYLWEFGDGNTSTLQNPVHTYQAPDTYDVRLIVTNIFGCADTIDRPDHVVIFDRPSASMDIPEDEACVPSTLSMESTSTPSGVPIVSYLWNFGNGVTSNTDSTSFFYTVPGTYNVSLVVTDQNGCRDTAVQTVELYENPTAEFMADQLQGCAIENITFTDLSTPVVPIINWEWSFGDGGTGTGNNPTYTYLNDGIYDVSLKITDTNGCTDSITKSNYIELDHPDADFSITPATACRGETVSFQDQTTGISTAIAWNWDFGDGNSSTLQNPTHSYTNPGDYSVSLQVTDALGCVSTITKPDIVHILVPGTPDFIISDVQGCQPLNVTFSDNSIAGDASIVSWSWNFGDGGTSSVQNPSYLFVNPGIFNVTLSITDANGCVQQITQNIEVLQSPQVEFTADQTRGCSVTDILFTDNTASPFTITQWSWDFGDGNTAFTQTPTNTYLNDGTYDVKLRVVDQNGCTDSLTKNQYIRLSHPVADFTLDGTIVCPSDPIGIRFTDTSTPDTTLSSWSWDFGDGNTSTAQNPSNVYASAGTYTIELIVTNVLNCSDTVSQTNNIQVRNGPTANFGASITSGCAPLSVQFTDSSTSGDDDIVLWEWDFDNGAGSVQQNPSHVFTNPGIYNVSLLVTDRNGCEHSDTLQIEVLEKPQVDFTANTRFGCAPETITFQDQTTVSVLINDWQWDFGDGFTNNVPNPTHVYTADGDYDVSLIVTDLNGCSDTLSRTAYIQLSRPIADFSIDVSEVCPDLAIGVGFTDETIPDTTIVAWDWDFGDGGSSTLQNPTHAYLTPGIYAITLEVTNLLGCTDQITQNNAIEVSDPPQTQFSASSTAGCFPLSVSFVDSSTAGDAPIVAWSWDFGDGETSTLQTPTHIFDTVGTFTVILSTTDANGCQSSDSTDIQVFDLPQPNFTANRTRGCAPITISFLDLSSGNNINQWLWDFGDGNTSNLKDPSHTYSSNGNYDVSLQVTDLQGCTNNISVANYIRLSNPVADFSMNRTKVCPAESISFTDLSFQDTTIIAFAWDFGDGNTSTNQNPTHTYSLPGRYTVSLTITNVLNCTSNLTLTDTIQVVDPAVPDFQANPSDGCVPLLVNFTDLTIAGDEPILSWSWDFGDGSSSIVQNPSRQYFSSGTYTVTLTVVDGSGCTVSYSEDINIYDPPVADFFASDISGCAPQSIVFTDDITGPANISSYLWDFGDGNTSNAQRPTHTYQADGSYTVSLSIIDENGCEDIIVKPNYIQLTHPTANFFADVTSGCPGLTVNFSESSTADTLLTDFLWDFGDGNTSTNRNPTHTYMNAGDYDVRLIITNARNCRDTLTIANYITVNENPTASFTPSVSIGCVPLLVNFTDQSIGNSAGIASWSWDFGNGDSSDQFNPGTQTFDTAGTYTVSLNIVDANGCSASTTQSITAYDPPVANFIANQTFACAPANIQFTDLSTGTFNIVSWLWDFGDGNTSTNRNPSHTYADNGIYTVSLTVTDLYGCQHTFTRPDYIRLTRPNAEFSLNTSEGCTGLSVLFRDFSTSDTTITSWLWDFGDGNTSTDQNTTHQYTTPGIYDITLTVTDARNCAHTLTKPGILEVFSSPTPSFTLSDSVGCIPLTIDFSNTSAGISAPIDEVLWDLGDGSTSIADDFNHTYTNIGTYTILLTVTDENGCFAQATQEIEVSDQPDAEFFANVRDGCASLNVPFTDISTGTNAITAWEWDFGDGNMSTNQNPTHTYTQNGLYDVELRIEDAFGCYDTVRKTEYIDVSQPQADFTFTRIPDCEQFITAFTDQSIPDTTLTSWQWDFGDGNTSTNQNPQHTYASAGTYSVQLIVTNVLGCSDTATFTNVLEVLPFPTVSFSIDQNEGCRPLTLSFSDSTQTDSIPIMSWNWQFGDGNNATVQNPSHTFMNAGTYDVILQIVDSLGCISQDTQEVVVHDLPIADFSAVPEVSCSGQPIQFTDVSSSPSGTNIYSWLWLFGDGDSSDQQNPIHTYTEDSLFSIRLTVFDDNGCSDTIEKTNLVRLQRPEVDFSMDRNQTCPNEVISFTDISNPEFSTIAWLWDFGDGETSTDQNPTHIYTSSGTYTVTLTLTDSLGCTGQEVKVDVITIDDYPVAQFVPSATELCFPYEVSFQNTSNTTSSPIANFQWDFGDGFSSIVSDPDHIFDTIGNYTVILIATDQNGCADTTEQIISTLSSPISQFTASDTIGCSPFSTRFIPQATGDRNIVNWAWDFGDGNTSTQQFPLHTYNSDGLFDVKLVVTDITGCTDSLTKIDFVKLTRPVVDFSTDQNTICPGIEIQFTDLTAADTTITSWQWEFGDGTTSSLQNPIHLYADSGTYTITLTVTNANNCSASLSKTQIIEVLAPPIAQFTPSDIQACAPVTIAFANTSQQQSATISGFMWDFGNGNTSIQTNGRQTYTQPGTYDIKLYATDSFGCIDSSEQQITIYESPTADFMVSDRVGCSPITITFSDASTNPNPLTNWVWNFGDGGVANQQFVSHTYTTNDDFDISLRITDQFGCTDSITRSGFINLSTPEARFSISRSQSCTGTEVIFTDESIPDTTLTSWFWDFGDGTTTTDQNPTHTYTTPGTYSISLTVTNVLGCSDIYTENFLVQVLQAPQAVFTPSSSSGCVPFNVSFTDASTGDSVDVVAWSWDFGNGIISTQQNPEVTYDAAGTFTVSLTVTDTKGCSGTSSIDVEALAQPNVRFSANDSFGCGPTQLLFEDLTIASAPLTNWSWDFGDGNTSNAPNPVHNYINDGFYDVSLTVTDLNGCTNSLTKNEYIRLAHPRARFTLAEDQACPGTTLNFTDLSTADTLIVDWAWDFGNGNTSTAQNPSNFYGNPGDYDVTLIVTDFFGCRDTLVKQDTIEIYTPPAVAFNTNVIEGCNPLLIQFTNQTQINDSPVSSWDWDFGEGRESIFPNPNVTYFDPGNYQAVLIATDGNGCKDTATQSIEVFTPPEANFTANERKGCVPKTIAFLDQSESVNTIIAWQWDFGDSTISTNQFPNKSYNQNGIYDITLTITDNNGCTDTLSRPAYIHLSTPDVQIEVDQNEACPGTLFSFFDRTIPDTTIQSRLWDFGDGTTSTQENPTHVYENAGSYSVSLTVTNILGCSRTLTEPDLIEIYEAPIASFVPSDTAGCTPLTVTFTENSLAPGAPIVDWQWQFNNNQVSSAREPQVTFTETRTNTVLLVVTDNQGCVDSTSQTISTLVRPDANFFTLDTLGCAPHLANFTDLSRGDFGVSTWDWNFGDGRTSTEQNPTHLYTSDGNFTVRLVIGDNFGCRDTFIRNEYIRLRNPFASFEADVTRGCPGTTITFTDLSEEDTTIISWEWDFGDGTTSTTQNPIHTYSDPGNYSVQLVIVNAIGCPDTFRINNYITIYSNPIANILASDTTNCGPFSSSLFDQSNSSFGIIDWEWKVNNTPFSNSRNATLNLDSIGLYNTTLIITDQNNCQDSASLTLRAFPEPIADFTASEELGCSPISIRFRDRTEPSANQWQWTFGDGSTSSEQNPSHDYFEDGEYTIGFFVTNQFGCSDSTIRSEFIQLDRPDIQFTSEFTPSCLPVSVTFEAEGTSQVPLDFWRWDFGDGQIANGDSIIHEYQAAGDYNVTLIGIDSLGCSDTLVRTVRVNIIEDLQPDPINIHHVTVEGKTSAMITFAPYPEENFEMYRIYRESPTAPGVYFPIDSTDLRFDTTYVDTQVDFETRSYCYKISVQNSCGTFSNLNQTQEHCTIEAQANSGPSGILIEWNAYRGWNVNQYEIYRVTNYRNFEAEFLAVVGGNQTQYIDEDTECLQPYIYRIKAVGSGMLAESWSDTTLAFNDLSFSAEPNELIRATVEDDENVLIEWSPPNLLGEEIIHVDRSTDGGTNWTPRFTIPKGELKVTDEDVNVSRFSYTYRVSVQDSCGFRTEPSNIGKTVLLEAERELGVNKLSWSPYEGWQFDVESYDIEVYNDSSGRYLLVGNVPGNTTTFEDNTTELDQGEYCYRIWANELGGNRARSLSNETCLPVLTNVQAPNAFTPNNDGINDVFKIIGFQVQTFNLQIYSRWGTILYESDDIEEGWDGTFNGKAVQEGAYVYLARGVGINGRDYVIRGTVTLLR